MFFKNTYWRAIGTLSIISSILMLMGAVGAVIYSQHFISTAVRSQGIVIQNVLRGGEYYPVYVFSDSMGGNHTVYSNVGSYPPEYSAGDHIKLLYKSGDPDSGMIDDFTHVWLLPIGLGGAAIVYLPVGLIIRWRMRKAAIAIS